LPVVRRRFRTIDALNAVHREQAQTTTRLVSELFGLLRTVGKVMRYLVDHDILMPVRVHSGPPNGSHRLERAGYHAE